MKTWLAIASAVILLSPLSAQAAVGPVASGTIVFMEGGWFGEGMAVSITGPGIGGCPGLANEFSISTTQSNYKDVVSLLTAAYLAGRTVTIIANPGTCGFAGVRTAINSVHVQ